MPKIKPYEFCHTHVHSEFSQLDGCARVSKLVEAAKEMGQEHLALTDHGSMSGCMEFYLKCKEENINPLIGVEAYVDNNREKHKEEKVRDRGHLILIAKNEKGYHNLCRITSEAYDKGFYYKPLTTYDVIKKFKEGIICTTACGLSPVNQKILKGKGAEREIKTLYEIFGDNLLLELQFNEWRKQKEINQTLVKFSKKLDIPLVVGIDVHYIEKLHHKAQDALLCINQNTTLTDPNRFCIDSKELYLKNTKEVLDASEKFKFGMKRSHVIEAMKNTVKLIGGRCELNLEMGKPKIPNFRKVEKIKVSSDQYLKKKCFKGLKKRMEDGYIKKEDKKAWKKQINHELSVIKKLGFADYILIISDVMDIAKRIGSLPGPGRGSAAGSRVCFALGITNINPEYHGLYFERFLNLHRAEMPDIDIDFDSETRDKIIDEVKKKYGEKKVRQILSVGRFHVAGLVRDLKKVLEVKNKVLDRLTWAARDATKPWAEHKKEILGDNKFPEIKKFLKSDVGKRFEWYLSVLDTQVRHFSRHPAGYVIAPKRIDSYVPLQKVKGEMCVAYTEGTGKSRYISKIGLLKVDFLGLITCSIIRNALALIKKNYNKDYSDRIWKVNPKDKRILKEFRQGNTMLVFQFESQSITRMMMEMRPDSLTDIAIVNAMHRPAVLESGEAARLIQNKHSRNYTTGDKLLDSILKPTYGSLVFEEQFLEIFHKLAGFDLDETDSVRREVKKPSKTRIDLVEKELKKIEKRFIKGCLKNKKCTLKKKAIKALWEKIRAQSVYSFNKSHSSAYSLLAWVTMWLKTRYPKEFVCAVLNARDNKSFKNKHGDKTVPYHTFIGEARRLGLKIKSPNVNKSKSDFVPTKKGKGIEFGLSCIKHISEASAKAIEREQPFESIEDFYDRVKDINNGRRINKRAIQNLINAGAFSAFDRKKKVRKEFNALRPKADIENPDDEWEASNEAFGFTFYHPFIYKKPDGNITPAIDLRKTEGQGTRVCVAGYVLSMEKRYGKYEILCTDHTGYFILVVDPRRCQVEENRLNDCLEGRLIKAVGKIYKKIYLEEIISLKKPLKKFLKNFVKEKY